MQILLDGLISGVTTALLATAFALVYLSARAFHIGLAGIYSFVPFVAWTLQDRGAHGLLAAAVAVLAGMLVSAALETFNHAPLERRGGSATAQLVTSLGIYIMLVASTAMMWGSEAQSLRAGVDRVIRAGMVRITEAQALALTAGSVVLLGIFIVLERTRFGLQLRALADNPREFVLRGHDRTRVRMIAFLMSGFLASTSALLVARDVGFSATSGLPALLVAIVGVIVGGRSSFVGPVLGAIIIMIIRAEVTWVFGVRWQDAATFALLAIVLYVRPMGLVGIRSRLEESA